MLQVDFYNYICILKDRNLIKSQKQYVDLFYKKLFTWLNTWSRKYQSEFIKINIFVTNYQNALGYWREYMWHRYGLEMLTNWIWLHKQEDLWRMQTLQLYICIVSGLSFENDVPNILFSTFTLSGESLT